MVQYFKARIRGAQGVAAKDLWSSPSSLTPNGSEVDRAIRAYNAGNRNRFDGALARALELFDLTAADDRWRGARRREILRARSEFWPRTFWLSCPSTLSSCAGPAFASANAIPPRGLPCG